MKKVYIDSTIAGLGITNCNYWFNAFSNCTEVRGFENLSGMTSATFSAGMASFSYLNLNYLFYTFSGCNKLSTIYTDATWTLPSSGITGSQCFYSCPTSLVGGNGTVWASSKTGYAYFCIDSEHARVHHSCKLAEVESVGLNATCLTQDK